MMRAQNTHLFHYVVNMVIGDRKKNGVVRKSRNDRVCDGDTPKDIVTYNMWREHCLIEIDPRKPRNFRLVDIAEEQLQRVL